MGPSQVSNCGYGPFKKKNKKKKYLFIFLLFFIAFSFLVEMNHIQSDILDNCLEELMVVNTRQQSLQLESLELINYFRINYIHLTH